MAKGTTLGIKRSNPKSDGITLRFGLSKPRMEAGLKIGATRSVGRRSPGTIANWKGNNLPPLSQQEIEHLQTRAAIPYRDPDLIDTAEIIKTRREKEQSKSDLEPSSHWKKRWSNNG